VAWALAVIVALGAGVPFAAWRVDRRRQSRRQPAVGLGPPAGPVDKWLIDKHRLPAVQRWQVRDAVLHGRAARDPSLRRAARDLAAAALGGRLEVGRGTRIAGMVLTTEGVVMIALGIVLLAMPGSPAGIVAVLIGAWNLTLAVTALRSVRRGPRRALELNDEETGGAQLTATGTGAGSRSRISAAIFAR
jgi:hypothetical protein